MLDTKEVSINTLASDLEQCVKEISTAEYQLTRTKDGGGVTKFFLWGFGITSIVVIFLYLRLPLRNGLFSQGYSLTFFIFFGWVFFYFLSKKRSKLLEYKEMVVQDLLKKKDDIEANINRLERYEELKERISEICVDVSNLTLDIPIYLREAQENLNKAEEYFKQSMFAPFWDKIEDTMYSINDYYQCIDEIKNFSIDYLNCSTNILEEFNSSNKDFEIFPINVDVVKPLSVINDLEEKMQLIIRPAQSDINFASIYEMRRTNQLLVAGFQSLSGAIAGLSGLLSSQLTDLNDELSQLVKVTDNTSNIISESSQKTQRLLSDNQKVQDQMLYEVHQIRLNRN